MSIKEMTSKVQELMELKRMQEELEAEITTLQDEIKAGMGNRKVLVGVSRKSMIYRLLGTAPEESLPATQALHMAALERGADILRVHDVAEAVHTSTLFKMLS